MTYGHIRNTASISFRSLLNIRESLPVSWGMTYGHIRNTASVSFRSLLNIRESLPISWGMTYGHIRNTASISFRSLLNIRESLPVSWGIKVNRIINLRAILFRSTNEIKSSHAITYHVQGRIQSNTKISYYAYFNFRTTNSISYYGLDRLQLPITFIYSIKDTNTVKKVFEVKYFAVNQIPTTYNTFIPHDIITSSGDIIPAGSSGFDLFTSQDTTLTSVSPTIVIGGDIVYVQELSISIDEGNFTYVCEATLTNYMDMPKFTANSVFYVSLDGEVYSFIVDSRSLDRHEIAAPKTTVRGVSVTAMLTGARSKQIIGVTFDLPLPASEIARQLIYDPKLNKGYIPPVDYFSWEILDWGLPPFRFGVENQYPLDSVKLLAEAVGAVVESTPDGKVRVRYKHPTAVPDYMTADHLPDHTFVDVVDILSIQEKHLPNKKTNSIYIKTFQDIGVADTIEYFDAMTCGGDIGLNYAGKDSAGGFVRVFPAIWRDTVELFTTNDNVELEYVGIEEDWQPWNWSFPDYGWETVEIKYSQGDTRYPINKVLGYGYMSQPAGNIITQDYSKTFYTDSLDIRFSLIKLSYTTKCHKWKLRAPAGTHLQLLVKDTVFNTYLR
jgi:hypothetical protein